MSTSQATDNKVEIHEGHAQWKIPNYSGEYRSQPFKMGIWNWVLSVEMTKSLEPITRRFRDSNRQLRGLLRPTPKPKFVTSVKVRLFPAESEEPPPLARFSLHVAADGYEKESTDHKGLLRTRDDFVFPIQMRPTTSGNKSGLFPTFGHKRARLAAFDFGISGDGDLLLRTCVNGYVIDVEFWELSISPSDGEEAISVWPNDCRKREARRTSTLTRFSRMLRESLYTDIIINTVDGKLHAHRAVLSTSSSVFESMFAHDLRENQTSTIEINDMTSESCMALLNYIYGSINKDEFWKNRLELLAAANKYNISELMDACEESLLEDIGVENVVERLKEARLYKLGKLKNGCITYLCESKNMRDILLNDDSERVDEILEAMQGH